MTGNTKVWRAPLAGLASVAMIATMGVAASTANAADSKVAPYNFTVTFDANGGDVYDSGSLEGITYKVNTKDNPRYADGYLSYNPSSYALESVTGSKTDSTFTGWYTQPTGGEKFNPDTFLNADTTLYAHYADRGQTVTVKFNYLGEAKNASIKNGFNTPNVPTTTATAKTVAGTNTVVVSKADNKLASWELPVDQEGTNKALTGWETTASSVNVDPSVAVKTDTLTSDISSTLGSKTEGVDQTLDLDPVVVPATNVKFHVGGAETYKVDVPHGTAIALPEGEDAYNASANLRGTEWAEQKGDGTVVDGQLAASDALNKNYDGNWWDVRATKTQQAFHVTYFTEINGTDVPFAQKIVDSNTAAPTDAPAKRDGDFSFAHYSDSVQSGFVHLYADAFTANVTSNKFLAAQWATDKVTVTFDLNYSGNKTTKSYATGDTFGLPSNSDVARNGWALAGWYVKADGSNPLPAKTPAYYTGSEAEFGYYKAGIDGQWGDSSVKKGGVYLTNGGHLLSYYDQYKLPADARLRIDVNGNLQYLNVLANPTTDPTTGETTYKPAWVTIPGTVYAAWTRAEKSDVNNQINKIPSDDEAGNNKGKALYKNWDAYRAEIDPLKAELEKPGLTAAQSAELMVKVQAAQAKLQVKTDQSVYRLYNKQTGDHYFTVRQGEYDKLTTLGVNGEGVVFKAVSAKTVDDNPQLKENTTALYSVYNQNTGEHLLVQQVEAEGLKAAGWQWDNDEKPVFYAPNAGASEAVYRVYNPNTNLAAHLYTAVAKEYTDLTNLGWKADNDGKPLFYLDANK